MEFHLCAPGPSMSNALCNSLRGEKVGVIGRVFELAPWAEFLAANDLDWWEKYPDGKSFAGARYTSHNVPYATKLSGALTEWSSGVLALQAATFHGATRIYLHGFDHHGTHYFGPYENGLSNTPPGRRAVHQRQFTAWRDSHIGIEVLNATPGSALQGFEAVEYTV